MTRLIGLLALAFLLYQGYKAASPWIDARLAAERTGSTASGDDEAAHCVDLAWQASRSLSDSMRQFSQPPVDQQEWTSAFVSVSADIGAAQSACACPSSACGRAADAVSELRDLSLSFDGVTRGGSRGIGNPARALERVHELLDEAERLSDA